MKLINSSIVFIFEGSAIHSLVLNGIAKNEVIPPNFTSKPKIHIPSFPTIIDLENGYSIHIIPNKAIIQINYPEQHNLDNINAPPDELTNIAHNFVKSLTGLNYKALGINFKVLISSENFFPSYKGLAGESEIIDMKFQAQRDIFLLINTINRVNTSKNEKNKFGILFDSNFHLELKSEKEHIIDKALSKRKYCLNYLKELINETFIKRT